MKAGPVEIGRLLQNRWRFWVPIYQRHYVWPRSKQWGKALFVVAKGLWPLPAALAPVAPEPVL